MTQEQLEAQRPKHPDFKRLAAVCKQIDDETEGMRSEAYSDYLVTKSGMSEDDLTMMALTHGLELAAIFLRTTPSAEDSHMLHSIYRMGWSAGFYEGRRANTGIEYMELDPDGKGPDFCGVDKQSFRYVVDQRLMRMLFSLTTKPLPTDDAKALAVRISACWVDGFFAGKAF